MWKAEGPIPGLPLGAVTDRKYSCGPWIFTRLATLRQTTLVLMESRSGWDTAVILALQKQEFRGIGVQGQLLLHSESHSILYQKESERRLSKELATQA